MEEITVKPCKLCLIKTDKTELDDIFAKNRAVIRLMTKEIFHGRVKYL